MQSDCKCCSFQISSNLISHLFSLPQPFVYDETKQLMVSYDDPQSFAAKGKFIIQNNLLGFAMWETTGDHNDLLIDSLTTAAGVNQDDC